MNDPQQQIAREAADKAWNENLIDQNGKTPLKAIILSAIERATKLTDTKTGQYLCQDQIIEVDEHGKVHPAQPQRSEQQEYRCRRCGWKTTMVCGHCGEPYWPDNVNLSVQQEWTEDRVELALSNHGVKGLAEIINDELTAERRRREEESARFVKLTSIHQDQLRAERQRREQADFECETALKQRDMSERALLSALAAIEKHNNDPMADDCPVINIDLSLLHERDAKLLKEHGL